MVPSADSRLPYWPAALNKKMAGVIESTAGITGTTDAA